MLHPDQSLGVSRVNPDGTRAFPEFFSPDDNRHRFLRAIYYNDVGRLLDFTKGIMYYRRLLLLWSAPSTIGARRRCALRYPELEPSL